MKIFAKRKRTVVDPETAEKLRKEQEVQKKVEADKAVQELLKLDPNKLNSKQRRLVKRYKERHGEKQSTLEQVNENDQVAPAVTSAVLTDTPPEKKSTSGIQDREESSSDSSNSDSNDDSSDSSDSENEGAPVGASNNEKQADDGKDNAKDDDLDEDMVKTLLEKLNSKQRRKLMRCLEREGDSVLREVHEEAVKLLKEGNAEKSKSAETSEPKKDTKPTNQASGKKRKKDWSDLPPEERLRREEQRRMQKEAAERRAKEGLNASKRHPLNSERRRANRRKPRWQSKHPPVENEHNSSGYHMRKLKKAGHV